MAEVSRLFMTVGFCVESGADADLVGEHFLPPLALWAQRLAAFNESTDADASAAGYRQVGELFEGLGASSAAVLRESTILSSLVML